MFGWLVTKSYHSTMPVANAAVEGALWCARVHVGRLLEHQPGGLLLHHVSAGVLQAWLVAIRAPTWRDTLATRKVFLLEAGRRRRRRGGTLRHTIVAQLVSGKQTTRQIKFSLKIKFLEMSK